MSQDDHGPVARPEMPQRIVVVGPCASGKSTLVQRLRDIGYDAVGCAQEHSDIPTLWRRRQAGATIALTVDLPTLRARRNPDWPEEIWRRQLGRLADAQQSAVIVIDTSNKSPGEVVAIATKALRARFIRPALASSLAGWPAKGS